MFFQMKTIQKSFIINLFVYLFLSNSKFVFFMCSMIYPSIVFPGEFSGTYIAYKKFLRMAKILPLQSKSLRKMCASYIRNKWLFICMSKMFLLILFARKYFGAYFTKTITHLCELKCVL